MEHTARAVPSPYRGHDDEHGPLMFSAEELDEITWGPESEGFDVRIHVGALLRGADRVGGRCGAVEGAAWVRFPSAASRSIDAGEIP